MLQTVKKLREIPKEDGNEIKQQFYKCDYIYKIQVILHIYVISVKWQGFRYVLSISEIRIGIHSLVA